MYQEILQMKMRHCTNQQIVDVINPKYGKTYNINYISTIFRQKILKEIAAAVTYHKDIVVNLPFPENFKKCKDCGNILLKDPRNFTHKTTVKDEWANRCKNCDKKRRKNGTVHK